MEFYLCSWDVPVGYLNSYEDLLKILGIVGSARESKISNWMVGTRLFASNVVEWRYILVRECASKLIFVENYNWKSRNCYERKLKQTLKSDESKKRICIECGELKLHFGKGMCQ
jgi:hypothetical protein